MSAPSIPVERFELSCGAQLLVSRREGAPVSAVQVHFRGGHSLDPSGLGGTAYLAGGLADQGTRNRTEEEIAALLEPAGGSLSGDSTGLSGTISGDGWKLLLDVLADVVSAPIYPREKFERHRTRLIDRLVIERDDPRSRAAWLFRRLVYGEHWLGRPDHGSLESVPRIRRGDLASYHRKNWCAARAMIAFCGDSDPFAVRRFLDRRLARWRTGKPLPPPDRSFPEIAARSDVFQAERQQVHVYLGHLGIDRRDPDYAALVVMDHILGTGPGFTSRITRRLRDELGLAYSVHAAIHTSASVLPGTFTAYIGTSPEHVRTAIAGFREENRRIQDEEVRPDELELAKSFLSGSFALGFERSSRRVLHMIFSERNELGDGHLERLLAEFAEVTAGDVRRVARKHLFPDRSCIVAAGPISRAELARIAAGKGGRRARKR